MKKPITLFIAIIAAMSAFGQNVGVGTTTPHTKLEVTGAISSTPVSAPAAATVTIPNNVSIFRLTAVAGTQANALAMTTPQEGQYLTIYNEDNDAATFATQTIAATSGVMTFQYINAGWRMVSDNQAGANNFVKNQTAAVQTAGYNISGNGYVGGNVGIGTTTPADKLSVNGNVDVYNSFGMKFYNDNGATQLGVVGMQGTTDVMLAATVPGNWLRLGANNSNIAFFPDNTIISASNPKVIFASNGNVGIGVVPPLAQLHTTGTVRLANYPNGMIGADASGNLQTRTITGTSRQVDVVNGNGVNGNPTLNIDSSYTESVKAGFALSGGGNITFDNSFNLSWDNRFIVISNGLGSHFSTNGFFDIYLPPPGTVITGVGGQGNVTVTSSGIPMQQWNALYYILPIGGGNTFLPQNLRMGWYGANFAVPENWVLVALFNGDDNIIKLGNGLVMQVGQTWPRYVGQSPLSGGNGYIQNQTTSDQTAGFRITGNGLFNGGKVGVGTTSPALKLDVVTAASLTDGVGMRTGAIWDHIYMTHDGTTAYLRGGGCDLGMSLQVDNTSSSGYGVPVYTDVMRLLANGNVGIGTTTPGFPLTVRTAVVIANTNVTSLANAISDPLFQLNTTRGATTNLSGDIMTQIGQGYNGAALTEAIRFHRGIGATDGAISITTSSAERMRITSTGNVGIGTNAPANPLEVAGNTKTTNFQMTSGAANGSYLKSDASGNGAWTALTSATVPNIYTADGTLTGARTVTMGANNLTFNSTSGNFLFSPSSTGFVGIGSATPASLFSNTNSNMLGADGSGNNSNSITWSTNASGYSEVLYNANTGASANGIAIKTAGTAAANKILDLSTGSSAAATGTTVMSVMGNGNVGIGTTNTSATYPATANRLYVNGPQQTTNLSSSVLKLEQYYVDMGSSNLYGPSMMFNTNNNVANSTWNCGTISGVIGTPGNTGNYPGGLAFSTKGADGVTTGLPIERMRITHTGNVGIGNTAPASALHIGNSTTSSSTYLTIDAAAAQQSAIQFNSAGAQSWVLYRPSSSSDLRFYSAGDRMTLQAGGNVGIGTNTPNDKLEVTGNMRLTNGGFLYAPTVGGGSSGSSVTVLAGSTVNNSGCGSGGNLNLIAGNMNSDGSNCAGSGNVILRAGANQYQSTANGNIYFYAGQTSTGQAQSNIERMRLVGDNGYVGIGTTSPGAPLHISTGNGSITTPSLSRCYFNVGSGGISCQTSSSGAVVVQADGYYWANGGGYVATSDERIKNIFGQSNDQKDLSTLLQVKVTDYKYKDEIASGSGMHKKVIAQQLNEVYPQSVKKNTQPEFIPNIYQSAKNYSAAGNTITATLSEEICDAKDIKVGGNCKFYLYAKTDGAQKEMKGTVVSFSDKKIVVAVSEQIESAKYDDRLFVYGTEINDLLSVDYEAIAMLNVSATQALSKQLKDAQDLIAKLQTENQRMNTQNNHLQSDVDKLKASVETLQQIMGASTQK